MLIGKITVITGPMKCRKTLDLILKAHDLTLAKRNVIAFHPENSERWGDNVITSRLRFNEEDANSILSFPSIPMSRQPINFFKCLPSGVDVVIFDDAQFFSMEIVSIVQALRMSGIDVYIGGLDMDCFLQPFGPMPNLMAIADSVIKLTAVCEDCQEPAQVSYRKVKDSRQELIGDEEYATLCYSCWQDRVEEEELDFGVTIDSNIEE